MRPRIPFYLIVCFALGLCLLIGLPTHGGAIGKNPKEGEGNDKNPIISKRPFLFSPSLMEPARLRAEREREFRNMIRYVREQSKKGSLYIKVNTPRANVYLDGTYRGIAESGKSLVLRDVGFGKAVLRVEAEGYYSNTYTAEVRGDEQKLLFELAPQPVAPLRKQAVARQASGKSLPPALLNKAEKVWLNAEGCWEASFDNGMVMVYVAPGSFTMGSQTGQPDEKPETMVYVPGFWMSKYEVTVKQYKQFLRETNHRVLPKWVATSSPSADCPVTGVSWHDAVAYCRWLEKKTGLAFRLPKEAEWEKAAKGGHNNPYPWGNCEPFSNNRYYANYEPVSYSDDGFKYSAPVGSFPLGQSSYGLHDMAGNVWEWCLERYRKDAYLLHAAGSRQDKVLAGTARVVRGGSWYFDGSRLKTTYRDRFLPGYRYYDIGFRPCVTDPESGLHPEQQLLALVQAPLIS